MKKIIGIISGEPNSINSEIIVKAWRVKNSFGKINFFIIGNFNLLKKQFLKMNYKVNIKQISSISNHNFKKNLCILNIPLKFNNPFSVQKLNKVKYINKCFDTAVKLIDEKKIIGLINCPIDKSEMSLKREFTGVTEFLAKKKGVCGKEAMLIYNKFLSVSPITTHIKLKDVSKNISKKKIIIKTLSINNFFQRKLGFKPKIGILGLNPHNHEFKNKSEEKKIIIPAINYLKKNKIRVWGPISPDTAFINYKKQGYNVLIGMYHDQVLTPFKALFKFNAINITTGLPFVRISPDHGVGKDIIKRNKANPKSLVESINFFKKINVKA